MNGVFCTRKFVTGIDGAAEPVRGLIVKTLGTRHVFTLDQVHGNRIVLASDLKPGEIPKADGIISANPLDVLAVRTADCVPVLAITDTGIHAAIHAGWRSLAAGIIEKGISQMRKLGAGAINISLGPAIGPCCFMVGDDVAGAFASDAVRMENGKPHVDLWKAASLQAIGAGIEPFRISVLRLCTCCHESIFFSYRRNGGEKSRQISAIGGNSHMLPGFRCRS